MTAVAVSNCVDDNQTSFISPSHSLPPPLTLLLLSILSHFVSLTLRPKIMRSLPSQGPFHIKNAPCLSSLPFHLALTLSLSTSRLPRDRHAPRRTHIRACFVSLTPLAHTKRFLSDPICLIVNEKANSTALISFIVYSACALCYVCVYIYLRLCKDVLACLKIPLC